MLETKVVLQTVNGPVDKVTLLSTIATFETSSPFSSSRKPDYSPVAPTTQEMVYPCAR